MTNYNASKMAVGIAPRYLPGGAGVRVFSSLALAALALNDTVSMLSIEAEPNQSGNGPTVLDVILGCEDVDTGAAAVLAVGDSVTADRYISGSTIGQGGGIARLNQIGGFGYQPFAAAFNNYPTVSNQTYTFLVTCTTAPAGFQAGKVSLLVDYTYDP